MYYFAKFIMGTFISFSLVIIPLHGCEIDCQNPYSEQSVKKIAKKMIKKFMGPIHELDSHSDINKIAKAAATFKVNMDKYFGCWIDTKIAWHVVIKHLIKEGFPKKNKQLKKLIRKIIKYESKIKGPWWMPKIPFLDQEKDNEILKNYELTKVIYQQEDEEYLSQDEIDDAFFDLPPAAMIGCVEVFCGIIICAIPFPGALIFGGSIVAGGITHTLTALAEDRQNIIIIEN